MTHRQSQGPTPLGFSQAFQAVCACAHDAFGRGVVVAFKPHQEVQALAARQPGLMTWFDDADEGWVRAVLLPATPNHYPALIVTDAVEHALTQENDRQLVLSMDRIIEEAVQISLAMAQMRRQEPLEMPWKPTNETRATAGPPPQPIPTPRRPYRGSRGPQGQPGQPGQGRGPYPPQGDGQRRTGR